MKNLANYLDEFDDEQFESLSTRSKRIAHFDDKDYIKANRKASREEEIQAHGKQVSMRNGAIHKSKKEYVRHDKHRVDWHD